ncbi:MAG: IclR family transcriptional regulator [Rhodospirillales bacterium]|nr:MAG: IclR family transcriptional regulator [Rhodospirillales bacterium]
MTEMRRSKGSSIRRSLAILAKIAATGRPITPTELNADLDLPRPTIHRLCTMLQNEGYLQRSVDGRGLVAGPKLRGMALDVIAGAGGQRAALHAILEELAQTVGETCNINVPDGNAMRYIDRVEARWPLRLQLPVGTRVPLHCTASGKMFLSSLPRARRKQVIANLVLEQRTPNTISDPDTLESILERIRADGFGDDNEEFLEGMVAVAVPVQDGKGRLIATLAMHGPTQRLTLKAAKAQLPALHRAADKLSRLFRDGAV